MAQDAALQVVIRARLRAKVEQEKKQGQLLEKDDGFHEQIRVKLHGLLDSNQFWNFSKCGKEKLVRTCKSCGTVQSFDYRCNLKWCPRCQARLAFKRRELISMWAAKISQPKHLVLTQKNFDLLTRRTLKLNTKNNARLRRSKCFDAVKGGCVSTEITNEGNGWHLHGHWLIDVKWLEMSEISGRWGKIVGQNFAICKVKDVREKSYIQEICKYVVKGEELAKWAPDQINEFVQAVRGVRMFGSFGTLRELAPQIRRELFEKKPPPAVCECGCDKFFYEDEESALLWEIRNLERHGNPRGHSVRVCGVEQSVAAAIADTPPML